MKLCNKLQDFTQGKMLIKIIMMIMKIFDNEVM